MATLSRDHIEHGLPWSWTPGRTAALLEHPDTNAYLARVGEQLAGFSIAILGNEKAHLTLLAVVPAQQRQGLGSTLLDWQMSAARTAGLAAMTLEVRASNASAIAFYEQAGFAVIKTLPRYYHRRETAVRMRCQPLRSSPAFLG